MCGLRAGAVGHTVGRVGRDHRRASTGTVQPTAPQPPNSRPGQPDRLALGRQSLGDPRGHVLLALEVAGRGVEVAGFDEGDAAHAEEEGLVGAEVDVGGQGGAELSLPGSPRLP